MEDTKSTRNYEQALKMLWRYTQTDQADGAKFDALEKKAFGGEVPEKLFTLMSKCSDEADFVTHAKHFNAPNEINIFADGTNWRLKKIDSTHFAMMNNHGTNWREAMVSHVREHLGKPYYDDVEAWLHGRGNPDGKKY